MWDRTPARCLSPDSGTLQLLSQQIITLSGPSLDYKNKYVSPSRNNQLNDGGRIHIEEEEMLSGL